MAIEISSVSHKAESPRNPARHSSTDEEDFHFLTSDNPKDVDDPQLSETFIPIFSDLYDITKQLLSEKTDRHPEPSTAMTQYRGEAPVAEEPLRESMRVSVFSGVRAMVRSFTPHSSAT